MKKNASIEKVSRFLNTYNKKAGLFIQSGISALIGVLLQIDTQFVVNQVSILLVIFFCFALISLGFEILGAKNKKERAQKITRFIVTLSIIVILMLDANLASLIFPIVLVFWVSVIAISNFVSFLQYRHEKNSAPIRYLITSLVNLFFAIYFVVEKTAVVNLISIYLIISAFTLLLDGLSSAVPNPKKNRLKSKIRITPPTLITAFIPLRLLNDVNAFFKSDTLREEDLSVARGDVKPNVEVLVHVSDSISGISGHVDLAINNKLYCFGIYDTDSLKFGGTMGHGVLYTVENKEEYINFCRYKNKEMLVGFGLALSDEEIANMEAKLKKIMERTYKWESKLQRAKDGEDLSKYDDYASVLYKHTNAKFYKFSSGSYKYYWALGTNCVKFADELLRASGINTIISGVITPGTYYYFLNNEFMNKNPMLVSRNVYVDKKLKNDKRKKKSKNKKA